MIEKIYREKGIPLGRRLQAGAHSYSPKNFFI